MPGMPMHKMMAPSLNSVDVWSFFFISFHSNSFDFLFAHRMRPVKPCSDSVYLEFHISLAKPNTVFSVWNTSKEQKKSIISSSTRCQRHQFRRRKNGEKKKKNVNERVCLCTEEKESEKRPIYLFVKCLSIQKTQLSNFSWQTQTLFA